MKVCFVYNPESGSGKIISYLNWIKQAFLNLNHEISFHETTKEKNAYYMVKDLCDCEMLLVAGGDGTLNEAINGVMEKKVSPIIAYIPTGTVNDVGHLIGMKRRIKKTVKLILEKPVVKPIDICKINDKYFIYVAAAGKFTKSSYDISRQAKKKFGRLAYFFRGSRELFKDYNMPIKITYSQGVYEETSSLIMILNGKRIGGFQLYGLKNKLDDGIISLRSFKRESFMFLRVIAFFLTGGLYDTRKNRTFRDSYFKIETDNDVSWNIDGEYMGKGSIEVAVIPKAINMVVNKKKVKKSFVVNKEKKGEI